MSSPSLSLELKALDLSAEWVQALVQAHRQVFDSSVDGHWARWKYGQGVGAGLFNDRELAAFCGGVPRQLWWRGRLVKGLQITDVMVQERWRQTGRQGGAFARVSAALYGEQLGAPAAPSIVHRRSARFAVGFGFPSHRHLRLARQLRLLQDAGPVRAAVWTAGARPVMQQILNDHGRRGGAWVAERLEGPAAMQAVQRGWEQMRPALDRAVVGDRRWEVLHWRHQEQPPRPEGGQAPAAVQWIGLRQPWQRSPAGVLVLRLPPSAGSDSCSTGRAPGGKATWLDWIGHPKLLRLAWAHALEASLSSGAVEMHGWFTDLPWGLLAQTEPAALAETARIGVPVAGQFNEQDLKGLAWWMMAGDTDFL